MSGWHSRRVSQSRPLRAGLITGLLVLACGCRKEPPAVRHAHAEAKAHTYRVPLDEVWPYALDLLVERGELVENNATVDGTRYSAQTDWVHEGYQRVRYIATGKSFADGSCQVNYLRQMPYGTNAAHQHLRFERAADLEWQLLRVVDPLAAAKIEASGPAAKGESATR